MNDLEYVFVEIYKGVLVYRMDYEFQDELFSKYLFDYEDETYDGYDSLEEIYEDIDKIKEEEDNECNNI